jgi:glycine cleavage system H lipoate-binding protein
VLYDPKFTVKPLTTNNPTLCVGHKFEDVIEVKNTSKQPIVLHISGKVLEINEKVRISPDETKKFKVRYSSK